MGTHPVDFTQGKLVRIRTGDTSLEGNLTIPQDSRGTVVFVHGSGSSRHSPRNQYVAQTLIQGGLGVLLFDLLTLDEEQIDAYTRHLRFDINLLAERTVGAADWLLKQLLGEKMKLGYFGSSTGAAAALIAAAERPAGAFAVVSRGGRPDLAGRALPSVSAPSLFIVGGEDIPVIGLNEQAIAQMPSGTEKKLEIVPGATHLFEEPGALERVAQLARDWFQDHLPHISQ